MNWKVCFEIWMVSILQNDWNCGKGTHRVNPKRSKGLCTIFSQSSLYDGYGISLEWYPDVRQHQRWCFQNHFPYRGRGSPPLVQPSRMLASTSLFMYGDFLFLANVISVRGYPSTGILDDKVIETLHEEQDVEWHIP